MRASKPKVLILGSDLDYVEKDYYDQFKRDYEVHVLDAPDRNSTQAKLPSKVQQDGPFQALVVKMGTIPYEPYDKDLLGALVPDCEIIVSASAGYNEFDIDWKTSAGMYFCNTVDAVSEATADVAVFLILATVRNASVAEKQARTGDWKTGLTPSKDPHGKVLGVLGMGSIGKHVAVKARVFGMKVLYFQRRRLGEEEERKYAATYCSSLEELLSRSDVISVHTPLNKQTEGLIGQEQFEQMKTGAFLVNTARGAIVNEEALIAALESGKIARAGLDVFRDEPNINEYFRKSDKVVLQPHMGGLTESAFAKSQLECLENLRAYFEKGMPNSPVNEPKRRR